MKKYLELYIKETEKKIQNKITQDDIDELLNKIKFFSHERLIHLLVTLSFALFSLILTVVCINKVNTLLIVVCLVLYIMLFFYIIHYFFLENGVQYLYKLYDQMIKKLK